MRVVGRQLLRRRRAAVGHSVVTKRTVMEYQDAVDRRCSKERRGRGMKECGPGQYRDCDVGKRQKDSIIMW